MSIHKSQTFNNMQFLIASHKKSTQKCQTCDVNIKNINYWYSIYSPFGYYFYYCSMKCMWNNTHDSDRKGEEFIFR